MAVRAFTDFDVEISRVLLAHRYSIAPGFDMDGYRHGRNMHGMVCALSGGSEYIFADGESIPLMPGEIALIPAAAAYRMRALGDSPFEHYTVNFISDPDTFPEWIPRAKMYVLRPKDTALYLARFDELAECWRRMRTGYRMQAKARLLTILSDYLTESMTQSIDPGAYSRTLPAKRMIETRYSEPLSLEQLADACGMCKGSFRRAFSAVYNQSPVAYLLNLRIEKSKELLLLGLSLDDVARETGFSDVNYFCRIFRRRMGMTAREYRAHPVAHVRK